MKIALTADLHLCSRHLGVSRRGPDYTDAALSAIEEADKAGCKVILNGGDTFHDNRPTSENVTALHALDEALVKNGQTMYVIDGDHDRADPSWWPTLLPSRSDGEPGIINLNDRSVTLEDGTVVYGIPACSNEEFVEKMIANKGKADILLWHGSIREFCGFPNPLALSIEDLSTRHYKAILMGDLHKPHQFVTTGEGCVVGYPGSTELRGRDETVVSRSIAVFDTSQSPYVMNAVPIKHRKGYAYQIKSQEQLDEVVQKLQRMPKEPWPMIFVRYDSDVPNVKSRLYAALDNPKAILKALQAPSLDLPPLFTGSSDLRDQKAPADFVPQFFPVDGPLRHLVITLCDPETDHRGKIDEFVDAAMDKILQQEKVVEGLPSSES